VKNLFSKSFLSAILFSILSISGQALAGSYILGLGVSVDDSNSYAFNALLDYEVTDSTSLFAFASANHSPGEPVDIDTNNWQVGALHDFGLFGIDVAIGQSGDASHFQTDDYTLGVFVDNGPWYAAADYLRRDIDLTFRSIINPRLRSFSLDALGEGFGGMVRYSAPSGNGVFISAKKFNYDESGVNNDNFFVLQRHSPTTVALANSLIETSYSIGLDLGKGEQLFTFEYSHDSELIGSFDVDTFTAGMLTPIANAGDLEITLGLSYDELDNRVSFLAINYYFYGGD